MAEQANSNTTAELAADTDTAAAAAGVVVGEKVDARAKAGHLSSRGTRATVPAISYLPAFMECLHNLYDAKDNADGHICLAVAENKLGSSHLFVEKWREVVNKFTTAELAGFQCCELLFLPRLPRTTRDAVSVW